MKPFKVDTLTASIQSSSKFLKWQTFASVEEWLAWVFVLFPKVLVSQTSQAKLDPNIVDKSSEKYPVTWAWADYNKACDVKSLLTLAYLRETSMNRTCK